jgi:hypothetical protein
VIADANIKLDPMDLLRKANAGKLKPQSFAATVVIAHCACRRRMKVSREFQFGDFRKCERGHFPWSFRHFPASFEAKFDYVA